jgi:hypothetical protein
VEPRDALGAYASSDLVEPCVGGTPGRERDLLFEDDLDQGDEPWRPIPKRRRAVARDDRRKMPVPAREFGDTLGQSVGGQLKRHVCLTSQPTCL